jgi:hypothetical protein
MVIGLMLAQGLALGVRMSFTGGFVAQTPIEEDEFRSVLLTLLLKQGLELVCLVIGSVLAGAGQRRGLIIGALIGLFNALALQVTALFQNSPINDVAVYAQPLLHACVGAIAGLLGSLIWRPLPALNLAPMRIRRKVKRPERRFPLFGGPIAWFRVLLGTAVVVAGVLSPTVVLDFLIRNSLGQLQITSQLQATMITWELIVLFILLGSGISGFNTLNGPKQGLCVGIAASFLIAGYQYSRPHWVLEESIFMAFVITTLSLIGSWFSCRLFPLVVRPRRRVSDLP